MCLIYWKYMEMMNMMIGEHGGLVCTGLAMEWLEKECRKKPNFGVAGAVPIDRMLCPIDRTGFQSQLTETVHCLIDQTENMSQLTAFWHCPIDRTVLSD